MSEEFHEGQISQEKIHSREEVLEILGGVIEGEFEVVRTLEDENGPCLIEAETKDEAGNTVLYTYNRAGNFGRQFSSETVIDVILFEDDIPVGGHPITKYVNGEWKKVE